ncbi:hypothetical protein [Rhizobium leguminosarum]|uniref:hypothetical protein n=1 Tax=Rhizobium leguminosarum TaxID=384 RepID=UPI001C940A2A|nr:hypothetical protein [Rhizobium leguminosarum]MBY5667398.1 hypothetical protein [Rhizobium leguminosarum]MBY5710098.1 hypothetical protein [Rhizobium leguminosarum]
MIEMNASAGSYSEFRGRPCVDQDRFPSAYDIISGKAYFPPDMRQTSAADAKNPSGMKLKAALLAAGIAIGSMFTGVVFAADGLAKLEKAWTIVVDRWTDKIGVEKVNAVDSAFNEHTKPLYAVLSPALKSVKPTIDMIVGVKYQAIKRDQFVEDRQEKAKATVLSNSQFKESASMLINEFDTAAACLNSKACNAAVWHENFDGAICGAQRTYGHFIDLQRQRLPTFASEYSEALKSIDCVAVLYK